MRREIAEVRKPESTARRVRGPTDEERRRGWPRRGRRSTTHLRLSPPMS